MNQTESCCDQEQVNIEPQQINIQDESAWYVDKEQNSQQRLNICRDCDQLIPVVSICRQCGCLMKIKTRIYSSSCPLAKW